MSIEVAYLYTYIVSLLVCDFFFFVTCINCKVARNFSNALSCLSLPFSRFKYDSFESSTHCPDLQAPTTIVKIAPPLEEQIKLSNHERNLHPNKD